MTDDHMEAWRKKQRRVLTDRRGERSREEVAVAAGLKYWRYVRLESGEGELKAAEVPKLARGYGIESDVLAADLGVIDWNPQAELEAAGMPEAEITATLATIADKPLIDQRAVIAAKVANRRRAQPDEPRRSEEQARRAI